MKIILLIAVLIAALAAGDTWGKIKERRKK